MIGSMKEQAARLMAAFAHHETRIAKRIQTAHWHYLVRPMRNDNSGKWIAFAKREPFTDNGGVYEKGDMWFNFAETEAEAWAKIRVETAEIDRSTRPG